MSSQLVDVSQSSYQYRSEIKRIGRQIPYSSALLTGLTADECNEILGRARPRMVPRGHQLYSQGQRADTFLLIQSGVVKLSQKSRGGTPVILWLIGAGDCTGHYHHDCAHSCSVEAVDTCGFLEWPSREVLRLCALFPQLSINIDRILTQRMLQLEERFTEIATEKVAHRVAKLLIRLEQVIGKRTHEGVEVVLKREELAQMIGASIFSVSRLLADWSDAGIVVARRRTIVIREVSRVRLAQYQTSEKRR